MLFKLIKYTNLFSIIIKLIYNKAKKPFSLINTIKGISIIISLIITFKILLIKLITSYTFITLLYIAI